MNNLLLQKIFIAALALLTTASALADPLDYKIEFGLNSGYTSNLLTDSTDIEDSFTTSSVNLKLYPTSSLELVLFGDYTYYSKQYNLSSMSQGVGFTFIPTNQDSRFAAYLSGSFSGRNYRKNLSDFDSNNFNLMASLGYRLGRTLSVRTGLMVESTHYLTSDTPDNESYEIFAGTNFTLFGSNSIDLEGGYSSMKFSFIPDDTYRIDNSPTGNVDYFHTRGTLNSFYLSPRFSRPLGSKIGLNLTFHHRKFINGDNAVILANALNFISPWGNIFEGQAYTISLKTIIVPKMIITSGFGYWKKSYLKTMVQIDYPTTFAEVRNDEQNRFFIVLERPIYFKAGGVLKPKLLLDITHNNTKSYTMFDFYDYSGISIFAGITYEL